MVCSQKNGLTSVASEIIYIISGSIHNRNSKYYHNVTGLSPHTTYIMKMVADNGISENEENKSESVSVITEAAGTSTTGIL